MDAKSNTGSRRRGSTSPRSGHRGPLRGELPSEGAGASARERYLATDEYRARREWQRYEGTAQRDLFRELRVRFLKRHAVAAGWTLDVGAGPGRFTPYVGADGARRVALDLSPTMLSFRPEGTTLAGQSPPTTYPVVGDAARPPFARGRFHEVVLLGNALGFAGDDALALLGSVETLLAPGGILLVEIAPGHGERSRYLARLPVGAMARLLAAPPRAVIPRILREGFVSEPARHREAEFRRLGASDLIADWQRKGWTLDEACAVAPCLGPSADRIATVRP